MIKSFLFLLIIFLSTITSSQGARSFAGTFEIMNENSRKFLDVADASKEDGARINQFQRTHNLNQRWSLYYEGNNVEIYSIISVNSDKAIANPGSSTQAGTQMQQLTYDGSKNQLFEFTHVGDGSVYLRNSQSQLYLGIQGSSKENGASVVQQTFTGGPNQRWYFIVSDIPPE